MRRLKRSAISEAGMLPTNAPKSKLDTMKPIYDSLYSGEVGPVPIPTVERKLVAGKTYEMTARS